MRPSDALEQHRQAVRSIVPRFRSSNPRVFGSVLHGVDHESSDLDVLVDTLPETTLFDLGGLQEELVDWFCVDPKHLRSSDQVSISRQTFQPRSAPLAGVGRKGACTEVSRAQFDLTASHIRLHPRIAVDPLAMRCRPRPCRSQPGSCDLPPRVCHCEQPYK